HRRRGWHARLSSDQRVLAAAILSVARIEPTSVASHRAATLASAASRVGNAASAPRRSSLGLAGPPASADAPPAADVAGKVVRCPLSVVRCKKARTNIN